MELYTRFPISKECISGYEEIPQGAICELRDNMIMYQGRLICYLGSQTSDNFCPNDPESILRADLLDKLIPLDPPDFESEYWKTYGEFNDFLQHWQWNEEILYYTSDELKSLLTQLDC